jgi:hypothetical protein
LVGWKEDEWRKQAVGVSLVAPEKRPRTKDDDEDENDWDMTLNIGASALFTSIVPDYINERVKALFSGRVGERSLRPS